MGERITPDSAVEGDLVRFWWDGKDREAIVVGARPPGKNFVDVQVDDDTTLYGVFNYEVITPVADPAQAASSAVASAHLDDVEQLRSALSHALADLVTRRQALANVLGVTDAGGASGYYRMIQDVADVRAELGAVHARARLAEDERDKANRQNESLARRLHLRFQNEQKLSAELDAVNANAVVLTDALHRLRGLISTDSRDWAVDRGDAWIYGLFCGWECDEEHVHDKDCDATPSMADRHGWSAYDVRRLRRYRAAIAAVQNGGQPDTEATEPHHAATEELLPGTCADGTCEDYPNECPWKPYRVCVECTAQARAVGGDEAPVVMAAECGRVITAAEQAPREPRVWRKGDPEPAIGTTVRTAVRTDECAKTYTRHDLAWLPGPFNWLGLLETYGEVVEVIEGGES